MRGGRSDVSEDVEMPPTQPSLETIWREGAPLSAPLVDAYVAKQKIVQIMNILKAMKMSRIYFSTKHAMHQSLRPTETVGRMMTRGS